MTNVAEDNTSGGPHARALPRELPNFDFKTPDEASMRFLEDQWLRFCRDIGLEGDVPDIRAILAAKYARAAAPRQHRRHWLVRPFVAVYHFFNEYH
jgi:hypothetical protein